MPSPEPATPFWNFEQRGWQKVAARYHDFFSSLTKQAITPLLDAVLPRSEQGDAVRLLDMATGPGYVAGAATARGAAAVGVDFSAAMAALASSHYPAAIFCVGDAEQLPFAAASFDAVVTNFGLLHLGRPEVALAEAHRVLRPGGRLGFTVWAGPQEAVAFGIILRAIEAHGTLDVPLPSGPPFFRFSDPEESSRALLAAGFRFPEVIRVPQSWRLPSPDHLFEAMESATVRTGGLLRAQSSQALPAIQAFVRDAVTAYRKNGGIELPMPAMLATAEK